MLIKLFTCDGLHGKIDRFTKTLRMDHQRPKHVVFIRMQIELR